MRRQVLILALAACDPSVSDPSRIDAAKPGSGSPDYVRYRGMLAATPTMAFGGDPYCDYNVVLHDVEIEVVLRKTEELAAMAIEDTMTETIVGMCPYLPEMPSRQQFTHDSAKPVPLNVDGRADPVLSGVAGNRPMTAAAAAVTMARDGTVTASARWERTDQGPPLKWIISTTAPVTLLPSSCTPGASVCVGGRQGALYSCSDGMQMVAASVCATGCAASKTACN